MNKFYLYILSRLNPLWASLGADPRRLHLILSIKLMMDDRRPSTVQMARRRNKTTRKATWTTTVVSLMFGLFLMWVLIVMGANELTGLTVYFSMFIVMLAMTLISDFTSVLIDVRDNYIILPRPVNDRTVLLARLLHIGVHLSKIVIPMSVPGIVYVATAKGPVGGILLVLLILLSTVFSIFLINLVYLLILRITTPARFREIINYVQIGFTIFIFAFYELFPQLMNNHSVEKFDLTIHPWIYCTPPFWFASVWGILIGHQSHPILFVTALLGILVPVISVWIVIRFLAPSFNQKLSAINSTADDSKRMMKELPLKQKKKGLGELLANLIIRDHAERAGFIFGWKITSRSKDFKLKVYPLFGYVVVFFLLFLWGNFGGHTPQTKDLGFFKKGKGMIFFIYLCCLMIANVAELIKFSNQYKAGWVYYISPMKQPGKFIRGVLKMIIFKYSVLIYLVVAVIALFFQGIGFIPNLLLGLANLILISLLLGLYYMKSFPFSEQWNINQTSGRMMKSFFLMILIGLIGLLHYFVMKFTLVVLILTLLVAVADWLILNAFGHRTWEEMSGM